MPRLALVAVSLLALALAGPAYAKKVAAAKVCGASECREVKDDSLLAVLPEGGDPSDPPSHPAGWYRVTMTIDAEDASDRFTLAVLPEAGYMRGFDDQYRRFTWMLMRPATAKAYREIVRGLEPLPVSRLRGLDHRLPQAQVVEVFEPAADSASEGAVPWEWVGGGLGAAALAGGALATWRRRRGAWLRRPGPAAAG
jgi:hypothetical protein